MKTLPHHGGQLHSIATLAGIPVERLLDFSANINPDGPPLAVVSAIRAALEDPATLDQYPDLAERSLREAIAAYAHAPVETIAVANGFVPLLEAFLRVHSIKRCLLPIPAFVEYKRALSLASVEIVPYSLQQDAFTYDVEALVSAAAHAACDAVLLANPQNPAGVLASRTDMLRLVTKLGALGIRVLLDEAFIDYAPRESLSSEVETFTNLTVFRSVTKFHGLPGLRVAYALCCRESTAQLAAATPPWAITTLASRGVIAALGDTAYVQRTLQRNEARRDALSNQLRALGVETYPSAANFLLLRLPPGMEADVLWGRLVRDNGIVLRHCGNFEGLSQDHLRCAVRNEADNARLVDSFATVLQTL